MRYSTAGEIEASVAKFWRKNGNVVLSEVRNGTGYVKAVRTADMMIFSTWPSRGIYFDGVEIKVGRQDLKAELANPRKADDMAKYCRCWWLACPDDLLTEDMIIPEAWGVITVDDKGHAKIHKASKAAESPVPMDALLVCSVIRNFSESHTPNHEIEDKVRLGVEERLKSIKADKDYKLTQFTDALKAFEGATGVNLLTDRGDPIWDMKGSGEAVKTLMEMRKSPKEALLAAAESLRGAGVILESAIAAIGVKE